MLTLHFSILPITLIKTFSLLVIAFFQFLTYDNIASFKYNTHNISQLTLSTRYYVIFQIAININQLYTKCYIQKIKKK